VPTRIKSDEAGAIRVGGALNLLQSRPEAARRAMLEANVLVALAAHATAQVWASALELLAAEEDDALTPAAFADALVRVVGDATSAAFLAAALGE